MMAIGIFGVVFERSAFAYIMLTRRSAVVCQSVERSAWSGLISVVVVLAQQVRCHRLGTRMWLRGDVPLVLEHRKSHENADVREVQALLGNAVAPFH